MIWGFNGVLSDICSDRDAFLRRFARAFTIVLVFAFAFAFAFVVCVVLAAATGIITILLC
jgi:hypothetical protein